MLMKCWVCGGRNARPGRAWSGCSEAAQKRVGWAVEVLGRVGGWEVAWFLPAQE